MIDTKLTNKVVLITGANNPRGIGAATARAFSAEGAKTFLHYFSVSSQEEGHSKNTTFLSDRTGIDLYHMMQAKSADEVIESIGKQGGQVRAMEGDLSDPSVVQLLFDCVEKAFGPVEILINNAAHSKSDTFIPNSEICEGAVSIGGENTTH